MPLLSGGVAVAEKAVATIQVPDKLKQLEKQLERETTLRKLTDKIHSSSLDDILLKVRADIQKLLEGERVTIYVVDAAKGEIFSKLKDGDEVKEIRIPISDASIAGFVAKNKKILRIHDAYDAAELSTLHPNLHFDSTWDKKTGFRTQQILCAPIQKEDKLVGVLQVVNRRSRESFTAEDEKTLLELANSLAIAFTNQKKIHLRRSKFDQLLVSEAITEEQLDQAQQEALAGEESAESVLMKKFKIGKEKIGESFKQHFRCDFIAFAKDLPVPSKELMEKLDPDYLKFHLMVPLGMQEGENFVVVMENPKDLQKISDIAARLGVPERRVRQRCAIKEDIIEIIDLFYGTGKKPEEDKSAQALEAAAKTSGSDIFGMLEAENLEAAAKTPDGKEDDEVKEDNSGIVKLVNKIIIDAYKLGASDIHIEPYPEQDMEIRLRIDGVCQEYMLDGKRIPRKFSRAFTSRLKIMCNLDIAERRLPQDGKIKFKNFGPLDIELRVATIPTTQNQEDVVMRILAASKPIPIDNIGISEGNLKKLKDLLAAPYGMALCVGPTGSGKTTTLHSALGSINTPDLKIWTAEDPVEITQYRLRQVQVAHKIGFTFERAMRAFLRADPDVIMVGEMRDLETTQAGIEASLTGHMVFSTLHTNSAPETVTRLLDMGIDPFSFGDSLLGVLAQRLCRRLCKECKEKYMPNADEWAALISAYGGPEAWKMHSMPEAPLEIYRPKGCKTCNNLGYKGRVGLHELMAVDNDLRGCIYKKSTVSQIRDAAVRGGMVSLMQDGIQKSLKGLTDLNEIRSVCSK
jgi:type II secretory ATPase GspE/PulE/Tfp pilus assembly ATPase PilB-like protein